MRTNPFSLSGPLTQPEAALAIKMYLGPSGSAWSIRRVDWCGRFRVTYFVGVEIRGHRKPYGTGKSFRVAVDIALAHFRTPPHFATIHTSAQVAQ